MLLREETLRLLLFLIVGVIVTAANTAMFVALLRFAGLQTVAASVISYGLAIGLSWLLQRSITFRDLGRTPGAPLKFVAVSLIGLLLTTVSNHLLHDHAGISDVASSLITAVPVAGLTFVLQRLWTFSSGAP